MIFLWSRPTWKLFHILTANIIEEKFDDTFKNDCITLFTKICNNIPCMMCRTHASEKMTKINRDEITSARELELFFYKFGELEYRSLKFEHEIIKVDNFQGNAIINYTDENVPFTRIIEHKHFEKILDNNSTVITKEFPKALDKSSEKYYPINNVKNNILYDIYLTEFEKTYKNIILGGRLACYKYLDMHQVIGQAMHKFKKTLDNT